MEEKTNVTWKDRWKKYQEKKKWLADKIWFRILNQILNLALACGTVVPIMYTICSKIPFTYEANDDAVIVQILDGSYTGVPDAHAIFVKYPLSWIMAFLFKKNPTVHFGSLQLQDVNWYVGCIVILVTFALVAVLYRMLNHFSCNRFLICGIYGLAFITLWLPCFMKLTFSTAAAFMGCMAILYLVCESKEEAWRPWNVLVLIILMVASYDLRAQCFYMVAPFLILEFIVKYHIHFFKSVKPWIMASLVIAAGFGVLKMNNQAYGSIEWKDYFTYNHARAYLQDYVGFPEYETDQEFYNSIGIDELGRDAMAKYNYCLLDNFSTDWVKKTYEYVKSKETPMTWREKVEASWEEGIRYATEKKQAPLALRFYGFYLWMAALLLMIITPILRFKSGIGIQLLHVIETLAYFALMCAEWVYLAINGRFPVRVEDSIRLLMVTTAIAMLCHFLGTYREVWMCRLHGLLQVLVILLLLPMASSHCQKIMEEVQGNQHYNVVYGEEKGEILNYCGQHPENYFVLNTRSFVKCSLPTDNTKQMNWIMSGSWIAYSPLYYEKLANLGTNSIGSEFLLRENVYIITKGSAHIEKLMGKIKGQVTYEIVDEYCSQVNNFYEIYKVTGVNQ